MTGSRGRWESQGFQWSCIEDGGDGCGEESGGGFAFVPHTQIKAEAMRHHEATGHRIQIDEMRSWRFPNAK